MYILNEKRAILHRKNMEMATEGKFQESNSIFSNNSKKQRH